MTIRGMVSELQSEMRAGDVDPMRARQMLIELTALYGNCATEQREADAEFNGVLLKFLDSDEAANKAKIRAQVTPEYRRAREAKDTLALVLEMIRSLKTVLKSVEEEMRLAR